MPAALHIGPMLFRFLALSSLLSLGVLAGCAAPSDLDADADDGATSAEIALTSSSLRAQTALDRLRELDAEAGSLNVDYAPSPSETVAYERRVAFEAVTFEASPDGAAVAVAVAGDFPSSATVIVTNERFEPLAAAQTRRDAESGLAAATVRVPAGSGKRLVLVRDPKWVKPMTFEVSVVDH